MNSLAILAIAAIVVQFITEQVKQLISEAHRSQITQLLAAIIGVVVAILLQTGIFSAFGIAVQWPILDYILTGIAFSAGASAFNEFIKLISEMRPSNQAEV